ncbi:MAG: NADH-quinone oxidoreductase subunit C [Coxiella-like endosymbiont]|uniref:NADH-quinone oxidoreductase subunit C n=1 Tax=Coxiella-like endosymbiont TaxID=1592897 RepID=UPI00215A8197|nr:NADH-quinone oxidoreductase subunit C [Coxiella-like endosymbiont]UVE59459.1 NADH-quinone oxidoreductase subunit C [Coxiella-like endosymbiont]
MADNQTLVSLVEDHFSSQVENVNGSLDIVTVELSTNYLLEVGIALRDNPLFKFELLLDICGVDYLKYGVSHWRTEETTNTGFSRGYSSDQLEQIIPWNKPRFSVVYHLLSITNNHRLRLKIYVDGEPPLVPSVIKIWNSADWYEREAFDLFGIVFDGHPDLRRLLTDYGFVGHPFRKDFPLIGEVELRYDAEQQRCVYEPVSIQPRVIMPKVIRMDNRYEKCEENND